MIERMLVVDDEEFVRDFWNRVFLKEGYYVKGANSAEEALEIVKKEDFQVFFLDLVLPGINGIELFKQLKHKYPKSFFCAMTGYATEHNLEECREAGFDDFICKPYRLGLLLDVTKEAFRRVKRWEMK